MRLPTLVAHNGRCRKDPALNPRIGHRSEGPQGRLAVAPHGAAAEGPNGPAGA